MANAVLHAHARRLTVGFSSSDGRLALFVKDDGVGFAAHTSAPAPGHFGLIGMRERADEIGADLAIIGEPGQGTRILLSVPLGKPGRTESNPERPVKHPV